MQRRYKRFLADVRLEDGADITVHCPNSGAMLGVAPEGARCWISKSPNPNRKHAHTLEIVEADGGWVGINTGHPNTLAAEGVTDGVITELSGYGRLLREQTYRHGPDPKLDKSRLDLRLTDAADGGPECWVEVKNVHLMRTSGLAEFPDSVTARGAKHLSALAHAAKSGLRAVQLYVVQRADCDRFAIADDIDASYGAALIAARQAGVEVLAYGCSVSPARLYLENRLSTHWA